MELIVNISSLPQSMGSHGDMAMSPPKQLSCSFILFISKQKEVQEKQKKYLPSAANNYYIDIFDRSLVPLNAREELYSLMHKARHALSRHAPELVEEGIGGTYFVKDQKRNSIGVFKPGDEEAFALNNPKKIDSEVTGRTGFRRGDYGYLREIGAYLIDKNNFSGVPPTTLVYCSHPNFKPMNTKMGSFQRYEQHDCASWDIGPGKYPIREVHKIAVLDLRIVNCDRHGGNMLVRECDDGTMSLIPIDHGFSLPDSFEDIWFEWFPWPQTRKPMDEETKRYIEAINIEEDLFTLRGLGIREECLKSLRISTTWLKKGAKADLTLHQIAGVLCLKDDEKLTVMERMIRRAEQQTNFFETIFEEMDRLVEKYRK